MVLVLAAGGGGAWWWLHRDGAPAPADNAARQERRIPVLTATAVAKPMPVRVNALGAVEPLVTLPIRSRVASSVEKVGFSDGAVVNAGDVLFVLDARETDAGIAQAEATLAKDKAQLEKAQRDVERYASLATRNAVSQVQVEDARTTADMQKATVLQDEANLTALRVKRTYYELRAPVSGKIGISSVRPGAVIKADDILATVRQLKPIYVAFGVPERYIAELRSATDAKVDFTLQGSQETVTGGRVAVIDNTVDPQTGTLLTRALFSNDDERLWPGTLGSVSLTLRMEPGVVAVPAEAIQVGQNGSFVFVVANGVAKVRPVTVPRSIDGEAVITSGLSGGETVVVDGQLSLRNGSPVDVKGTGGAKTGNGANGRGVGS